MTERRYTAREASDYFNSLPIEQRRKLAPLLEDYRLMGMQEALGKIEQGRAHVLGRIRQLKDYTRATNEADASGEDR